MMLRSIDRQGRRQLHSADWYVSVLIAEAYGLEDSAHYTFQQAVATNPPPPEVRSYDSAAELARRRLTESNE